MPILSINVLFPVNVRLGVARQYSVPTTSRRCKRRENQPAWVKASLNKSIPVCRVPSSLIKLDTCNAIAQPVKLINSHTMSMDLFPVKKAAAHTGIDIFNNPQAGQYRRRERHSANRAYRQHRPIDFFDQRKDS
ncbi:hypothetical protein [Exilibacterium tricleocarpae]|uniref:hypothetical protein n=1 Tax=Exilibacterium tricleocarpae TaxID=2591008 RepID=UPI0015D10866|nr:hypothetical protein [Exilibacterium tricleocarpae]